MFVCYDMFYAITVCFVIAIFAVSAMLLIYTYLQSYIKLFLPNKLFRFLLHLNIFGGQI